jgi:hypothetical protein
MAVELTLDQQIKFIEAYLMFDAKENLVCNPFIAISNVTILTEIRKSLIELKESKAVDVNNETE